MEHANWKGFKAGAWQTEINVRDFIQTNYTEYLGDSSFLATATKRTTELMTELQGLLKKNAKKVGCLTLIPQPFLHSPTLHLVTLTKTKS